MSLMKSSTSPSGEVPPLDPAAQASSSCCSVESILWATPWFILTLLMSVSFVPFFVREANLDYSYIFCSDYAFLHGFRYGIDFLGTSGPWGFAYGGAYQPQVMGWMIAAQTIVGIGLFAGIWRLGKNLRIHPLLRGLWVVLLLIWAVKALDDSRILAMCLLPMLLRRTDSNRRDSIASFLVVLALALAGLAKFTFLTCATGTIVLLSLEDILRKRLPKLGLGFLAMVMLLWLIAGQKITDLPNYLLEAWRLASKFSEEMGLPGPDFFMIPTVVVLSAVICVLMLARFWKSDRLGAAIAFLITALTLFFCFKEGFLRYDGHELIVTTALTLIAFTLAPLFWIRWTPQSSMPAIVGVRTLALLLIASSIWCMTQSYDRFLPNQLLSANLEGEPNLVEQRAATGFQWICHGTQIFEHDYQAALANVRATTPLPMRSGTVDILGTNQLAVIAAGMNYDPRPLSPGYQAASPDRIDMNRRFLLGSSAPDNIFFVPEAIDNHFPSLEDGGLWPELMAHYLPTQITPTGVLALRRDPQPRTFTLTPISSGSYRLDQHIPVPIVSTGAVWAQIKMRQTLLGEIGTTLLRTPPVDLEFTDQSGTTSHRRLIPGMAEAGFVLSPVVSNSYEFLSLMIHPTHESQLADISIHVRPSVGIKNWFDPDIQVTFSRLDVAPPPPLVAQSLASLANLAEMSLTTDFPAGSQFFTGPDGQQSLMAHPITHMQLAVPPNATHLQVGYGIRPEALDKTNGVIFIISAVTPDNPPKQIFTQTLQPQTQSPDRPQHDADIPLPPACSRIIFETHPVTTLNYDWAYWSNVRFE